MENKENFNFNTYHNYISYNKFNLYYIIDMLLYDIETEINFNKKYIKELVYNLDYYKIISILKNYTNKLIFNYDKENNLLSIDLVTYDLINFDNNILKKGLYNSYRQLIYIDLNDININYLKELISNYFKIEIEIKEKNYNDLDYYQLIIDKEMILSLKDLRI